MTDMSRIDHLAWCKARAQEYLQRGAPAGSLASFLSDLGKHPEQSPVVGQLAIGLMLIGELRTTAQVQKFIDGTN